MEPAEIEKYMSLKASRKKASQKFYATHVKDVKERTPEEEVRKEAMLVYRREKAKMYYEANKEAILEKNRLKTKQKNASEN